MRREQLEQQVQQYRPLLERGGVEQIGLPLGQLRVDEAAVDERECAPVHEGCERVRHETTQEPARVANPEGAPEKLVMGVGTSGGELSTGARTRHSLRRG
jgi:hypothetical protein